jgi:hypothetical protein
MNLKAVCSCPFMPVAVQHLFYVRALVVIDQHPYSECLGLASYVAPAPQYEQYAGYAVSQPVPIAPTGYAPVQVFSSLSILASQVFMQQFLGTSPSVSVICYINSLSCWYMVKNCLCSLFLGIWCPCLDYAVYIYITWA